MGKEGIEVWGEKERAMGTQNRREGYWVVGRKGVSVGVGDGRVSKWAWGQVGGRPRRTTMGISHTRPA